MMTKNNRSGTQQTDDDDGNTERSRLVVATKTPAKVTTTTTQYQQQQTNDSSSSQLITVDDALERLGYGTFQIQVMVAAGLCFAADSLQIMMLSFLSIVLQAEWGLNSGETALITSTVFCGATIGTMILGPLGDKIGRRPVFILAAVLICFFGFATAACNSMVTICFTIFMVGLGVGGLTVPFDILAELLPMEQRGKNLLFIEYFWTAGALMVPLFAYITIVNNDNGDDNGGNSWRYFAVLCAVPSLVSACLGTYLVPESPRWLVTVGQSERALAILRDAATVNGWNAMEVYPPGTVLQEEAPEGQDTTICDLFSPTWRELTIRLWTIWGGFAFLYYGTIMSITVVFSNSAAAAETSDDGPDGASFNFDYEALVVSCSAEIFGITFAIMLVDRVGRVPLQGLSLLVGGLSVTTMLLLANYSKDDGDGDGDENSHRTVLIILAFIARWFMMSGSCTSWVGTAELLTTDIRTTGHAAANAVARIGSFCAPFVVQPGISLTSLAAVLMVVTAACCLATVGLPETKGVALGDAVAAQQQQNNADGAVRKNGSQVVEFA